MKMLREGRTVSMLSMTSMGIGNPRDVILQCRRKLGHGMSIETEYDVDGNGRTFASYKLYDESNGVAA